MFDILQFIGGKPHLELKDSSVLIAKQHLRAKEQT